MRRIAVDRPATDDVVYRDNMMRGLVSGAPGMAVWAIGCATGVCSLHGHIRRGASLMVIRRFAGSDRFVGARPRSSRGIGNPSTIRRATPSVNRRMGRQGDDSRVFTIAWLNRHAARRRFRATAADIILGGGTTQHGTRRT